MRLPRRLEQICASIYTDENDIDSKIFAINRISAWRTVTSLPHALESTLALLVPLVHDKKQIFLSTLQLRQSYATAILRLVNGLVDPLQVGTYARSITSIAQQLGIPNWLVELRHASTHEDLPSLDLLREATRHALTWLLQNYFLPILNPVAETEQIFHPLRPLQPLLKLYKATMKTITRDLSLVPRYRPKLIAILRDLERWIADAKLAANTSAGETSGTDVDLKETWALERFCESLAEKGILVPLSKKKRRYSDKELLPSKTSIAFWEPLLDHIQAIHPGFLYIFLSSRAPEIKSDPTYDGYIACWISWALESAGNNYSAYLEIKKYLLSYLVKSFSHGTIPSSNQSIASVLLRKICTNETEFETMTLLLSKANTETSEFAWDPHHLDVMIQRNDTLQSYQSTTIEAAQTSTKKISDETSIPGWSMLEEKGQWQCCPIGVYNRSVI
ncbi:Las1-like-domain-containing protein [Gymnopilus junonius]|uniref:Las1-like-domain-containing protein n=1 Tax=Gymnopilus junonius TaxID=109634 RepID=A0A9P5P0X2_GYMJU|nr:Las1-like-domain-containing protein [Gymnopilus junonius]